MAKKNSRTVSIVYPVCCRMDIHKNFLVACVAVTDERSHTEHHIRHFSTYTKDLRLLVSRLGTFECRDVCMESAGLRVCLTHPKYVKAIKGKKTDKQERREVDIRAFQVRPCSLQLYPIRRYSATSRPVPILR